MNDLGFSMALENFKIRKRKNYFKNWRKYAKQIKKKQKRF